MTMKNQIVRISMFYCSNSLQQNELDFLCSKTEGVKINSVSLPCSGKVNLLYLLKSIEMGSDGVLLLSCKFGECQYLQGNFRAQKRIEHVNDLLSEIGFERRHVRFVSLEEGNTTQTLISAINELAETCRVEFQELQK
jgi:coenzyme F420-reducing hydrogenase delta subunit